LLGFTRVPADHVDCAAAIESKCGKCGQVVSVPLDPDIHPYPA
jgi:hypothetical protein